MKTLIILTLLSSSAFTHSKKCDHGKSEHLSIQYGWGLPCPEKKQISRDLEYLRSADLRVIKEESKIFDTSPTLSDWLSKRISYFVGHDLYEVEALPFEEVGEEDLNNFPLIKFQFNQQQKKNKDKKLRVTLAHNVTAGEVQNSRWDRMYYGIKVDEDKLIPALDFSEPVININMGFFYPSKQIDFQNIDAEPNKIWRLAILFHEARHSDTDKEGLHAGMLHAICPKGHDFEGRYACDANLNGPYTVGADTIKLLKKQCQSCTEEERAALDALELSSRERVIEETKPDYKYVATLRQLQQQIETQQQVFDLGKMPKPEMLPPGPPLIWSEDTEEEKEKARKKREEYQKELSLYYEKNPAQLVIKNRKKKRLENIKKYISEQNKYFSKPQVSEWIELDEK